MIQSGVTTDSRSVSIRFWGKVQVEGDCWVWQASKTKGGYGNFTLCTNGKKRWIMAHRWAYLSMIADIPDGLDLDHLCRNRACVNPYHLDPVTRKVNLKRGKRRTYARPTHCPQQHPYSGRNVRLSPSGTQICVICARAAVNRSAARDRVRNGSRWNRN